MSKEKKTALIISTFFIVIIFSLSYCVYHGYSILENAFVENKIVKEVKSIDNSYRAVVFVRDTGATTRSSYQLSILKKGQDLENESGNVFISYSEFDVMWKDNKTLKVRIRDKNEKIFKQLEKKDNIIILYE